MRRFPLVLALALTIACGSKSPTSPTPTPTPTPTTPTVTLQSVALSGAVSGLTQAGQTVQVTATGTFSNGTTQNITNTCSDWASDNTFVLTISNSGVITARNSGASTVTTSCQGMQGRGLVTLNLIPAQLWTRTGSGDTVFDMPTYIRRVRITGTYTRNSSNFIVRVGGQLLVNELLGTGWNTTRYDGTLLTTGGVVAITNSSGVAWTFAEVR